MSKLTLSVDDEVVSQAKKYALANGISISELVEGYLRAVSGVTVEGADPPVLRMLQGKLKHADREDYRRHLTEKYR